MNELLESIDAKLWAKEFIRNYHAIDDIQLDEDLMTTWFSNAMTTAYTMGKNRSHAMEVINLVKEIYSKPLRIEIIDSHKRTTE